MFPIILTVAPNAIGKSPRTETFGDVPSDKRMTLVGSVGGLMVPARSPEATALRFDGRAWTREPVVSGSPALWPRSGASEVAVGHLGGERFVATIEPWHGNEVVVYRQRGGNWMRLVVDATISDGHTLVAGDFDGDGRDELVAGERAGRRSVYLYGSMGTESAAWFRRSLDDGGMPAAGCAVADVNGDGRPDVVCIGSATATVKWYENVP